MSEVSVLPPPAGLTIRADIERVGAATVSQAHALASSTLHESGGRIGALPSAIKPVAQVLRL